MKRCYKLLIRKLLVRAGICIGVICSSLVNAIGLGDLKHDTFLGQPLNAEIDILGSESISPDNIIVRNIGSRDAKALGVDLLYSPYRYQLVPELKNGVLTSVRLLSRDDILEPYVNILIELRWPTGSVLREYALLFDAPPLPPAPAKSNVIEAGVSAFQSATEVFRGESEGISLSNEFIYQVQPGDTLSGIVSKINLPKGVNPSQAISSIFARNPSAFQSNDINLLKAGSELTLPAAPELLSSQGYDDSSSAKGSSVEPSARESNNDLRAGRLTLSEPSDTGAGMAGSEEPLIRDQIDGTQEMIDLLLKENQELRERIENIESSEYMNTLSELVAMQRKQIERLQGAFGQSSASEIISASIQDGTTTADFIPVEQRELNSVDRSLADHLAANFWLFIGLVVIGFFVLVSLAIYAIRTLGVRRSSLSADNSYNEAASFIEEGPTKPVYESYESPNTQGLTDLTENFSYEPVETELPGTVNIEPSSPEKVSTVAREIPAVSKKQREKDEEVKARIRQKTEAYNATQVFSQAPSRIDEVEMDVLVSADEEINELLSMAKIYCSAGKYSEARAILSAQGDAEQDPRLNDALKQIEEMEREG